MWLSTNVLHPPDVVDPPAQVGPDETKIPKPRFEKAGDHVVGPDVRVATGVATGWPRW